MQHCLLNELMMFLKVLLMLYLSEDLTLQVKFVFNKLFVYNCKRETIDHKNFKC